jgi:SAM-dependent methyltransferase
MGCDNCLAELQQGITPWHFECSECGLEASTLTAADLNESDAIVDEADREAGLESLRKESFKTTIQLLNKFKTSGTLLDIGCAHGWFLDAARAAGYTCTGIEPSARVAQRGSSRGHRVLIGYFPSALGGERGFDVVSYNDVFEHIPHARETMRHTSGILAEDGILCLAIPSNRGFFYRLSKLLSRFGVHGPFERMWQKHFSSPHLYYFNETVLTQVAVDAGMQLLYQGTLPSIRVRGLWNRLAYDTTSSTLKNAIVYAGVVIAAPFLRLLPADIDLLIYQKKVH